MSDTLGTLFRVTSFGESHGPCVGVVVSGCPAGLGLIEGDVQHDLDRRRAKGQPGATTREEADRVRILSGVHQGRTTGAPVCLLVENANVQSAAYADLARTPRPGHADYPAGVKYGGWNDVRGGGRFSGRITAGLVMAGAVARLALRRIGVEVDAHTVAIGGIEAPPCPVDQVRTRRSSSPVSCCDESSSVRMASAIETAHAEGDSVGGVVECVAIGLPCGLGEPVFAGLEAEIAHAVLAIPAAKGVEFGAGFAAARLRGSQCNDPFCFERETVMSTKNDSGGALGGMATGMPLVLRVAFKPTPSISLEQQTVALDSMENTTISIRGRHDACIVPRAVVVVEAMVSIALCDLALQGGFLSRVMK